MENILFIVVISSFYFTTLMNFINKLEHKPMPFFNNRPRKHCQKDKVQAKIIALPSTPLILQ